MPSEPAVPVRAGRPSRSDAAQFTDRILDAATARFLGKAALFEAVVRRLVGGWRVPFDTVSALPGTLEQRLEQIARFMLAAALTPEAIALHRLIMAEAARF